MTHLEGRDQVFPLEFYTFREITQEVTYPEARQHARTTKERVLYIACSDVQETLAPRIPTDAPPGIPAGACRVIVIDVS
jgi:hypothetical protein